MKKKKEQEEEMTKSYYTFNLLCGFYNGPISWDFLPILHNLFPQLEYRLKFHPSVSHLYFYLFLEVLGFELLSNL
jgi:hypothetical protein